jgi:hypothetical protein
MADTEEAVSSIEADTPLPAQAAASPRRGSALPAIAGGVVAAAFGFGAAQFVPDGWPLQSTAALEASLATQSERLASAEAEVARLSAALAAVEARPAADPGLATRIAAIEATPSFDPAPLTERLSELEADIAAFAAMPADGSAASSAAQTAALAELRREVEALKANPGGTAADITAASEAAAAQMAEAEARAAELRAAAEAEAAQSIVRASLRQIAVALESGGPFEAALADFDPALVPPVLATHAATGLPTLTDLRSGFPDAARAALDVALRADMGETWGDRVTSFLRSQTGARSLTPRDGDDPDAVLSRIEAALAAGSVADGLALLPSLPEVSQTAMAEWLTQAQLHLEGQQAHAALTAAVGGVE